MVFYDPVTGKIQLDLIPFNETRNERSRPTTPPPNRQYPASPGDELLRILRCIAKISDLGFSTKIGLVHDRHVEKRQMEEILDAGLGEPWMILEFCHDEPWADELYKERKDVRVRGPPLKSHSGMELLGKCVCYEKKIVIFDRVCDMVSRGMKLHQKDLVSVVLAHEASHAVTHLRRDHDGRNWSNFSHADVDDTEQFAQIYAFLCLKNARDSSLEKVFQQLSDRQSRVYNLWKVFKGKPVKEINRALMKARLKSPSSVSDPMKSYIEKKRTPLPLPKEIEATLKHLEHLEPSISNPDWTWERGYRVSNAILGDTGRLNCCGISGVEVNVVPRGKKGCDGCAPLLLVIIGFGRDGLERRIIEAARYVTVECHAETESVVFWTTRWNSLIWMKHADSFNGVNVVLKLVGVEPLQIS